MQVTGIWEFGDDLVGGHGVDDHRQDGCEVSATFHAQEQAAARREALSSQLR